MDYPNTMVKNHIRFHHMTKGTPFDEKYWHLDNAGEYLQLEFRKFIKDYESRSEGEQAFCRFLISVWDKHHEEIYIAQFQLADALDLDERYLQVFKRWAADPFWA